MKDKCQQLEAHYSDQLVETPDGLRGPAFVMITLEKAGCVELNP